MPTNLAFRDNLISYDLICLPNNCNNYTALVKSVHPFLVMTDVFIELWTESWEDKVFSEMK